MRTAESAKGVDQNIRQRCTVGGPRSEENSVATPVSFNTLSVRTQIQFSQVPTVWGRIDLPFWQRTEDTTGHHLTLTNFTSLVPMRLVVRESEDTERTLEYIHGLDEGYFRVSIRKRLRSPIGIGKEFLSRSFSFTRDRLRGNLRDELVTPDRTQVLKLFDALNLALSATVNDQAAAANTPLNGLCGQIQVSNMELTMQKLVAWLASVNLPAQGQKSPHTLSSEVSN